MEQLTKQSAIFVGLARDCAQYLPFVLDNIHDLAALFGKTSFVFAENDSHDTTAEFLRIFCNHRSDCHRLNFDGLLKKLPQRTRRLAFLRNKCLSVIRADKNLRTYNYLIVMDMDASNTKRLNINSVLRAFEFLNRDNVVAGVFGNACGPYYDLWALRDARSFSRDVWEEQFENILSEKVDDITAYKKVVEPRIFTLPKTAEPIEVLSAFGGLGIYKLSFALKGMYQGTKSKNVIDKGKKRHIKWQICEHVSFNKEIVRSGGKLYILPFLVNRSTEGLQLDPSFYRSLIF